MLQYLEWNINCSSVLPDVDNNINDSFGQDESGQQSTQSPTEENEGDGDGENGERVPDLVVIPEHQKIDHHDNKTINLDKKEVNRTAYKVENESVDNNDNNIIINININKSGGHNVDDKDDHTKYYTYSHGPRRLANKHMASNNVEALH
ncbi:unnamed protein product [Schistosoma mattheei]|uniref:Uncharacterized protein n=1 Tax=Schistosoma mattheei TaxID=31246 RepID=A0AA85B1B0_9TREM|nr:unnamed protein product [Schistosoma mattheei]CAH8650109.1 unnamed protein product [Schistosoma mattheei]